jgi:hypothetical protein
MLRAYWRYNGQWKHVYILDHMKQLDLFGGEHIIAKIKLVKNTKETHEVDI